MSNLEDKIGTARQYWRPNTESDKAIAPVKRPRMKNVFRERQRGEENEDFKTDR